jgi:hypothetical protein
MQHYSGFEYQRSRSYCTYILVVPIFGYNIKSRTSLESRQEVITFRVSKHTDPPHLAGSADGSVSPVMIS